MSVAFFILLCVVLTSFPIRNVFRALRHKECYVYNQSTLLRGFGPLNRTTLQNEPKTYWQYVYGQATLAIFFIGAFGWMIVDGLSSN